MPSRVAKIYPDVNAETLPAGGRPRSVRANKQNDDVIRVSVRDALRAYLIRAVGKEQKSDYAERMGIKRSDLTNAYNGRKGVSLGMLQKIASVTGVPVSDIFRAVERVAFEIESGTTPLPRPPRAVMRRELRDAIDDESDE